MSLAPSTLVYELAVPVDPAGWESWLIDNLLAEWRPGEWNAEALLFTGDFANPLTWVFPCKVVACMRRSLTKGGACGSCTARMRREGLTADQLVIIPGTGRDPATGALPRCAVSQDNVRCGREVSAEGLCESHSEKWPRYLRDHQGANRERWASGIALPMTARPGCGVAGCADQVAGGRGLLCRYHAGRRREAIRRGAVCSEAQWAARDAPWLAPHQFSLVPLAPLVRLEFLYALQRREARGAQIAPGTLRQTIGMLLTEDTLAAVDPDRFPVNSTNRLYTAHELIHWVHAGYSEFRGLDPAQQDTVELRTLGLSSTKTRSGRRTRSGTASLASIQQGWLRSLLVSWARLKQPESQEFSATRKACIVASTALSLRPGGGHDPAALRLVDMDAVVDACAVTTRPDETLYAYATRKQRKRKFGDLLEFARREDLLPELSPKFAVQSYHRIPVMEVQEEDEAGKAIPEYVIRQLDEQLASIGRDRAYGPLRPEDTHWLMKTAYMVCRDTGRRPREFCGLALECLRYEDGQYTLIWDNFKGKRLKRSLPIEKSTAEAILAWQRRRLQLVFPQHTDSYLFPAIGQVAKTPHLSSHEFGQVLRAWVDGLERIDSDAPDEDGTPLPFDRSKVFAYAFRSSYAQRHADAGTPLDVLMALMDHRNASTTMGYYRVTIRRKRQAVETLRLHAVDRRGNTAPFPSGVSYEQKSVAVPFGGCTEPSNVKAGGQKCPIRFQCAGCGFYRPDPSYLPAIEDHVRELKADRELAEAMGVDDFVIRNLSDQVTAFQGVIERMNERMTGLPEEIRAEIQEASRVLRKVRATNGRTLLPLTVVNRQETNR
ncbi:tyrosine-type recombinase/integrase [Streptomyces formicae]|uniref:Putative transposase n=1 Tax=Streptomyces formicae TaxID=1616117 RepID=A0A291QMP9_9ACTN|nr:tyrosine-type recombinase/integrase [Streptomyces formicae]ATL32764.1 putative transposase [Streptomyces formicae]